MSSFEKGLVHDAQSSASMIQHPTAEIASYYSPGRLSHIAVRLGLAVSIGVGIGTVGPALEPRAPAALAASDTYPDKYKPCANLGDEDDLGEITGVGYWCDGYDWGNIVYDSAHEPIGNSVISPRGYGYRNCTDWVAWRIKELTGITVPTGWGNGKNWDNAATAANISVDTTPEVGDIAVWETGTYGHVAVVESLNPLVVSEYNHHQDGTYGTRTSPTGISKFIDLNGPETNTSPSNGASTITSFVTADGVRHVVSANGPHVSETWWVNGTAPVTENLWSTGDTNRTVNDVSSFVTSDGIRHVFSATSNGKVHETWYGNGQLHTSELWPGDGSATTAITGFVTPDGVRHVISGTHSGGIYETWFVNGQKDTAPLWTGSNTAPIKGLTAFVTPDNIRHVISVVGSNKVYETWYGNGSKDTGELWTAPSGRTVQATSSFVTSDNIRHVFAGLDNGDVYEIWWGNGQSGDTKLRTGNGTAVNSLDSFVTSDGIRHVITAAGSKLDETWFGNGTMGTDTLWTSGGATNKDVSSFVTPDGVRHVVHGLDNGEVYETWFAGGQKDTVKIN